MFYKICIIFNRMLYHRPFGCLIMV